MENSYSLEKYAQMRHRDMVETARIERLIREVKEQRPKPRQKLTWRLGDWMIRLGHWLKHQQHNDVEVLIFKLKD
jgi:hypothetical protein